MSSPEVHFSCRTNVGQPLHHTQGLEVHLLPPPPVPFKAVEGLADVTASAGQPLTAPLPPSKSLQGQLFWERFPSLSLGDFARCKTQEFLCGAEEQSQTPRGLGSCPKKHPPTVFTVAKGEDGPKYEGGYHHLMDVEL